MLFILNLWIFCAFWINTSDSSKMVCSPSTVQAHPGQDVVLSCRVEPPSNVAAETLEWKHGTEDVHVFRSGGDDPDNKDPRFKGRTFLNHQNLKDGNVSLTLTNFTKKDEGNYTLCLRMRDLLRCSNVTLTKIPQMDKEINNHAGSALSSGGIIAIVLGVLAVVGGIPAFIYCRRFCFHRSEEEEKEPAVI